MDTYLLVLDDISEVDQVALLDPRLELFSFLQCSLPNLCSIYPFITSVGQPRKTTLPVTESDTIQMARSPVRLVVNVAP